MEDQTTLSREMMIKKYELDEILLKDNKTETIS